MYVEIRSQSPGEGPRIGLRCPHCGHDATFERFNNVNDLYTDGYCLGIRKCPSPRCNGQLFFIASTSGTIVVKKTYPALRIDFDSAEIPERIKSTLLEAITCHAEGCYIACAIMVRRCLEELREDRAASGDNLKARIQALRAKVVLPNELFVAMDEIRILGNDAAHIEAKVYDDVGEPQVNIALELTKEILKATYQLDSLVKRIKALKASP